jgi:hypothetical protein
MMQPKWAGSAKACQAQQIEREHDHRERGFHDKE